MSGHILSTQSHFSIALLKCNTRYLISSIVPANTTAHIHVGGGGGGDGRGHSSDKCTGGCGSTEEANMVKLVTPKTPGFRRGMSCDEAVAAFAQTPSPLIYFLVSPGDQPLLLSGAREYRCPPAPPPPHHPALQTQDFSHCKAFRLVRILSVKDDHHADTHLLTPVCCNQRCYSAGDRGHGGRGKAGAPHTQQPHSLRRLSLSLLGASSPPGCHVL